MMGATCSLNANTNEQAHQPSAAGNLQDVFSSSSSTGYCREIAGASQTPNYQESSPGTNDNASVPGQRRACLGLSMMELQNQYNEHLEATRKYFNQLNQQREDPLAFMDELMPPFEVSPDLESEDEAEIAIQQMMAENNRI